MAPAGQRFQDWLATWDATQIERWLADNKCSNHAALFAAHDITGAVLLDVDHQALKEMGIHSVGERIKIAVAVKKLRQACVASQQQQRVLESSKNPSKSVSPAIKTQRHPPPPLQLNQAQSYQMGKHPAVVNTSSTYGSASSSSNGSASLIPPNSNNNHPQLASHSQSSSSSGALGPVSPNGRRSPFGRSTTGSSSASTSGLPAPKSSLPPPPPTAAGSGGGAPSVRPLQTSSERLRTSSSSVDLRSSAGGQSIPGNRPKVGTSWNNNVSALGFPTKGSSSASSATGSPQSDRLPSIAHRKAASSVSPGLPTNPRPGGGTSTTAPSSSSSASSAATTYGHHQPLSSHPFATNSSPTMDQFPAPSSSASGGGSSGNRHAQTAAHASRPSTAGSAPGSGGGLSPITESHSQAPSPIQSEYPRAIQSTLPASVLHSQHYGQNRERDGFTVGKGSFGNSGRSGPSSSQHGGTASSSSTSGLPPASLEELLKRAVKFVGEEGEYKMVNVEGCRDATDILTRALRKFGKLTAGDRADFVGDLAEMDGWAVYATTHSGASQCFPLYLFRRFYRT